MSSLLITPIFQTVSNSSFLDLYRVTGVIQVPGHISTSECDVYYSFSRQSPIPIPDLISVSTHVYLDVLSFSFLLKATDLEAVEDPAIMHVTAEASLDTQSHRFVEREEFHYCDRFIMNMKLVTSEEPITRVVGKMGDFYVVGDPRKCY